MILEVIDLESLTSCGTPFQCFLLLRNGHFFEWLTGLRNTKLLYWNLLTNYHVWTLALGKVQVTLIVLIEASLRQTECPSSSTCATQTPLYLLLLRFLIHIVFTRLFAFNAHSFGCCFAKLTLTGCTLVCTLSTLVTLDQGRLLQGSLVLAQKVRRVVRLVLLVLILFENSSNFLFQAFKLFLRGSIPRVINSFALRTRGSRTLRHLIPIIAFSLYFHLCRSQLANWLRLMLLLLRWVEHPVLVRWTWIVTVWRCYVSLQVLLYLVVVGVLRKHFISCRILILHSKHNRIQIPLSSSSPDMCCERLSSKILSRKGIWRSKTLVCYSTVVAVLTS